MSVSDPVADFLTCIRNAIGAKHRKLDVPSSRLKEITELKAPKLAIRSWPTKTMGTVKSGRPAPGSENVHGTGPAH